MAVQSASELAKEKFEGFTLKGYEERLGFLEPHTAIFIWGSKGSGKSTASLRIAKALAENKGNVIYFTPEEGVGRTMQDKINRVGATHNRLYIADWNSLAELKREVTRKKAAAVFLDSAQMSRLKDAQIEELYQWARVQPVILVIVNHATKTGDYKGNSMFAHMVDIELMVMDGIVSNQKNRCGGQGEWEVDFGSDSTKAKARKNPVPVPFRTTLSELDKRFKIRGAARLNQLAGFQHGCYTKHHKGQKENSVIQFRYDRNTTQKLSTLDLVLDNRIIDSFCEKDFKTAWAKCVKKYHDLSIYITDQAHAKTVLGAAEYRKQERAAKGEKNTKQAPKRKVPKEVAKPTVKTKAATKPKTAPKRTASAAKRSAKKAAAQPPKAKENNISAFDKGMASLNATLQSLIS